MTKPVWTWDEQTVPGSGYLALETTQRQSTKTLELEFGNGTIILDLDEAREELLGIEVLV